MSVTVIITEWKQKTFKSELLKTGFDYNDHVTLFNHGYSFQFSLLDNFCKEREF